MFVTTSMEEGDVWAHEDEHGRDDDAIARADLLVAKWREVRAEHLELTLVRDDDPPRHVTVTGWSDDLATKKKFAQELASRLQDGDTKLRPQARA